MKVRFLVLGLGLTSLLSGCTGLNSDRYLSNKKTFMLNQGNPPTYVDGYADGCSTGRRLGGDRRFLYRKNNTLFEKDALYARGWQEGQINCRNEALAEAQQGLKKPKAASPESTSIIEQKILSADEKAIEAEMREIWEELKK